MASVPAPRACIARHAGEDSAILAELLPFDVIGIGFAFNR